ncbi:type II toxin-antitoxin system CcdA family antitoxin [Thalassospira sp. ER-Se-21-Dark]|uniref:type II toxin-antitoxin system CcdA family antitoxin n=1 Tax=Thalassospira sp. ER-Se-21-Dark TaxID=2585190 RepID=UPI001B302133|nr:type II toxin-antitoxin system CcdA family antitoxin [Thalassospira sp. ER-Se-21-Dark]MBP3126945.1 post-segregation antitoxin CcdA [Thalassospira sp. ER-Se-21-Dark]
MTADVKAKQRKPTNVSLDAELLQEAKKLGINISRSAESGLRDAISMKRAELWKEQNKAALAASNSYVEKHGIPLAKHRKF